MANLRNSLTENIFTGDGYAVLDLSNDSVKRYERQFGISLQTLIKEIRNLPGLQGLNLMYNGLVELPENVGTLDKLVILYLGRNRLKTLPSSIANLKHLRKLWLQGNDLTGVPEELKHMPSLEDVDLQDNNVKTIPAEFHNSLVLDKLNLKNNPLVQPPPEVWNAGMEQVREYLKQIFEGKSTASASLRVVLLGDIYAGKTSLAQTLMNGIPSLALPDARTVVVSQHIWEPEPGLLLRITDFGGHDIYRIIYPLFLSSRLIVLLVVNLSLEDDKRHQSLRQWLQSPVAQTQNSTVIIVATHTDKLTPAEIDHRLQEMRQELDMYAAERISFIEAILGISALGEITDLAQMEHLRCEHRFYLESDFLILAVSSKNLSGFDCLKGVLLDELKRRPVILPETWQGTVTKLMQTLTVNGFASPSEVATIFAGEYKGSQTSSRRHPSNWDMQVQPLLELIHSSGLAIRLHASDNQDNILVSPDFLVKLLKCLFHHNQQKHLIYKSKYQVLIRGETEFAELRDAFVKNGILTEKLLQCLWMDQKLSRQVEGIIVTAFNRIGIWYEMKDSTTEEDSQKYVCPASRVLRVPWIISRQKDPSHQLRKIWPDVPEGDAVELQFIFGFLHQVPQALYERASVMLHRHLSTRGYSRSDWSWGVLVKRNHVLLLLTRREEKDVCSLQLKLRCPTGQLPDMWKLALAVLSDIRCLLKEIPHVVADEYMACPQCIISGKQDPCRISMGILRETCSLINRWHNIPHEDLPAALLCPIQPGDEHSGTYIQDVDDFIKKVERRPPACPSSRGLQLSERVRLGRRWGRPQSLPAGYRTEGALGGRLGQVQSCTTEFYKYHAPVSYRMISQPRGKVLIINNNLNRPGTDIDRDKLYHLWIQLGFDDPIVYNHQDDLTDQGMRDKLHTFARLPDHKTLDCCVVCIMTHGLEGLICGTNGVYLEEKEILGIFNNNNCPALRNKPKIFIFQACRGEKYDEGVVIPDRRPQSDCTPNSSDILVAHPTQAGYVALRDTARGSWYINELVDVFTEFSCSTDVCAMLNLVNGQMSQRSMCSRQQRQMSEYTSSLRKQHLFFFPGIHEGSLPS